MKAIWKGRVLAESDDTVVVEGNHYFPARSLDMELFRPSATRSVCPWKGEASYYDVVVDGADETSTDTNTDTNTDTDINADSAWYYPEPKSAAAEIKDRVAFWRGVTVEN